MREVECEHTSFTHLIANCADSTGQFLSTDPWQNLSPLRLFFFSLIVHWRASVKFHLWCKQQDVKVWVGSWTLHVSFLKYEGHATGKAPDSPKRLQIPSSQTPKFMVLVVSSNISRPARKPAGKLECRLRGVCERHTRNYRKGGEHLFVDDRKA